MIFSRIRTYYYFIIANKNFVAIWTQEFFSQSVQLIDTTFLGKSFVLLPAILNSAHTIIFTHISEKGGAQVFVRVFEDRDIIYNLQHKQPF